MPVPGFFAHIADKAQTAVNATPLAGHIPNFAQPRTSSPDPSSQPPANQTAAQGGGKSHAMEAISYQFRNLQQQYSTTTPIQRIITLEKGISMDYESLSRDSKSQSKELYTWGQSESEDLKDVTDRLAYLNFVQGSIANSVAAKLDAARAPLKVLRDAEANLLPKRNIRAGMQNTLKRLEGEQVKGNDRKIAELRESLKKAEAEDEQLEKGIELSKRKALRESEQLKWDAIREYGEKLILLSQAATPIIAVLPSVPPSTANPYTGRDNTGAVRASLQRALDNYKTGHIHLPPPGELSKTDTQSFGESHASELSSMYSEGPTTPLKTDSSTSPINPQVLNQSPAPIPGTPASTTPAVVAAKEESSPSNLPAVTPTIAETGIPVSAGPGGPGPSSGSLNDIKAGSSIPAPVSVSTPTPAPAPVPTPKPETAEEEKKRLAASYSSPPQSTPAVSAPAPVPTPKLETAEEEKKRLAALYSSPPQSTPAAVSNSANSSSVPQQQTAPGVPPKDNEPEELPPYQPI